MLFPELLVALLESAGKRLKFKHISIIELAKSCWRLKLQLEIELYILIDTKFDRKFLQIHRRVMKHHHHPIRINRRTERLLYMLGYMATWNSPNVWKMVMQPHADIPSQNWRENHKNTIWWWSNDQSMEKKTKMHGFADWLTGFRTWKSPDTSYFPWDSHVFPRFSIGFPRLSMGPRFSMGFSMFSMGFSMFSMGFSKVFYGFPGFSIGFYMVLGWSVEDALRLMMFLANPTTWTDIQRSLA